MKIFGKFKRCLTVSAALIIMTASLSAANWDNLPVKNVNGRYYHYYSVQPHETVYALSKRFGIEASQIVKLNPSAAEGIRAGEEILIAVADKKAVEKAGKDTKNATALSAAPGPDEYLVKKEETAYGVSRRFNISLEEFYALNPSARNGLKEGQIVKIKGRGTPVIASAASSQKGSSTSRRHTIAEHETLYQIARDNGVSLTELLEANPGLDAARYEIGTVITIPAAKTVPTSVTLAEEVKAPVVKSNSSDTLRIAVVLPFNVGAEAKHNLSMVEFYRGFLLAVDSMRNYGQPLKILTYDTKDSDESFDQIIALPELKAANVIIGPSNSQHLNVLNEFGQANGIPVINVFNNRDLSFQVNPFAIQTALPRGDMYNRAADAFISGFGDYTPVFLISNDGRKDKTEFIDIVKEQLGKKGRSFKEIGYTGKLDVELLTLNLPDGGKYAFLPSSSHRDEFEKIEEALTAYKGKRENTQEVIVWGYPEWLANTSNYAKMHELDCYIYSRNDQPEPYQSEQLNSDYLTWYGPHMLTAFPRRAYMGFDTGMFILNALRDNGKIGTSGNIYSGITMPIQLTRFNNKGGYYNDKLLMINMAPGEIISKRNI